MATPNMLLTLPDPLVTLGPLWAQELNTAFGVIDNHDHSSGKGLPVTPAGLNINAALTFNTKSATDLGLARFTSLGAVLVGLLDKNQVYVVNGELYYQDGSGTNVQITAAGSVNIAGVGGISGLSGTTAALTYSNSLKTFILTQDSGISAKLDTGRVTIRDEVGSANGVTLKSPSSLAGSYTLTLPAALPASTKILTVTSGGVVGAAYDVDGSTLEVSSNSLRLKDAGITTAKIGDAQVSRAKVVTLGRGLSSSCGVYNSGSTGVLQTVTNLSQAVTLAGGDVLVSLQPDGTTGGSNISNGALSWTLHVYRDASEIARFNMPASAVVASESITLQFTDTAGTSGAATFAIKINDGGGAVSLRNYKLAVRELL